MNPLATWIAQILSSAFLAVLFLQSGLDKVFDWEGNKGYIASVFAKTPLARMSTPMLLQITVLEVVVGLSSAAGCVMLVATKASLVAFVGAALAGLNVLALFFGQRIAKDYAGAAGLVPYMLFALATMLLQAHTLG
jgi:CBS domain containing-hemolysin-like protein